MSELDPTNIAKVEARSRGDATHGPTITLRVSPHSYFVAVFLGTFLSAFLFYLEMDDAGYSAFVTAWVIVPVLGLTDRIAFDGRSLTRTGVVPRLWRWFNGGRRRLKIGDIEQVETHSLRTWKRGGVVHYRYRTSLRGKGSTVVLASGGDRFRQMAAAILPQLPENALDIRSLELRSYLTDPKEVVMKAEFARLPSGEMLLREFRQPRDRRTGSQRSETTDDDTNAVEWQQLGNELRIAGHITRGLESFRRALLGRPRDARLIFDFARCLQSFAGVERDLRSTRKALAAFRLAELRAGYDSELLARIGEIFLQVGESRYALRAFQRSLAGTGSNLRATKGLAEMALQEGKIAHVIHHFAAADRSAETPALRRWAKGETQYFTNLNSDEEYMETEIHRVQMLETIERSKRAALRISFFAFPFVTVGVLFDDTFVANIGWAASGVSLLIWAGLLITGKLLSRRIPYELMADDEQ